MTTAIPASHADLLDTSIAVLATIGSDGRPQLSTVWFLADDGVVRVSLNSSRQKTRNLRANPAVNLFIQDPSANSRYLELRGDATIEPDDDYAFADRVGAKYGANLRDHDAPGQTRVVVTINPQRVNAVDMSRA